MIQTKLTVNQPGDRFEQEAERVADQVMRMPDSINSTPPRIQRMCSHCEEELHRAESTSTRPIQRMCAGCEEEPHHKESSTAATPGSIQIPSGEAQPLPEQVRGFFEPRFSQDFGRVRIHTDRRASESAQGLNAIAYTAGSDIVFAEGRYSPDTAAGKRLLAHELTHVIQQGSKRGGDTIQRACLAAVRKTPGCVPDPSITPPSTRFLFNVNCDDFAPGLPPFLSEEGRMDAFARALAPTATVRIVGLASFDGPAELNERLACRRAERGRAVIRRSAPPGVTISSVDATVGGPTTAHDPNMRAVGVNVLTPPPKPTPPKPTPPKPSFPPKIQFWYHVFIPNTVSGARKAPGGPFAGRTVFPSPPLPFHFNSCFETDDRGFSSTPAASSRTRVQAELDTAGKHLTFAPAADLTFEIDCTSGALKCSALPKPSVALGLAPGFLSPSGVDEVLLSTTANDPCVAGSPDFAIRGKIAVDHAARTFDFEGATTLYPAFEMYADFGAGARTVFVQPPIVDNPFALLVPGLNPRKDTITF